MHRLRAAVWPCRAGLPLLALGAAFSTAPAVAAAPRTCGPAGAREATLDPLASVEVRRAPGFALMRGATAEAACAPLQIAATALTQAVHTASADLGVDPELAVVLSATPLSCPAIFYLALANDIRGIGYAHVDAREVFDDTPGTSLDGVAFLNDWPYWQEHPDELESAFNHEVGHRWGARVHVRAPGLSQEALLGRDREHWSYFLSTGGSPLEGNVWVATDAGYQSQTTAVPSRFSPLDLYLMGVSAPEEVGTFTLLTSAVTTAADCTGHPIGVPSPPQRCADIEFRADALTLDIEQVIAAEGPRSPPPTPSREVDVLVLLLDSPSQPLSLDACQALSGAVESRLAAFAHATSGRLLLRNVLEPGGACEEVCAAPSPANAGAPRPGACTFRAQPPVASWASWTLVLAGWLRRRRAVTPISTCTARARRS